MDFKSLLAFNRSLINHALRIIAGSIILITGMLTQSFIISVFLLKNYVTSTSIRQLVMISIIPFICLLAGPLIIFSGGNFDE